MADKKAPVPFIRQQEADSRLIELLAERKGLDKLNNPKFTTKDTNLSYRMINHWAQKNLLPNAAKKGRGWHKFTLTEMVWLKIIGRLRNFGFSIKKIAEIKTQIIPSEKKTTNRNYAFLDCYITHAFTSIHDTFFIIFADGSACFGSSAEIDLVKDKLPTEKRDMLLISLKGILKELGEEPKPTRMRLSVDQDMGELLMALRSTSENQSEVNLKIRKGVVAGTESNEVISETPDFGKISENFKAGSEYGEVTIKYEAGKPQSAHVKKRRRFSNLLLADKAGAIYKKQIALSAKKIGAKSQKS